MFNETKSAQVSSLAAVESHDADMRLLNVAVRSLPYHVVKDLLSIGVRSLLIFIVKLPNPSPFYYCVNI